MKPILSLFAASVISVAAFSQVSVEPDVSANDLVFDFLLGSGVLIEDVEYGGADIQIGSFMDMGVIGLDSGLVMSTADVENIDAGNDAPAFGEVPFGEGVSGDADLLDIANSVPPLIGQNFSISAINDVVSLEFDFIPYGDSLAFNYIFGSDEYPVWVNTAFNDAFAFFISGPGITGPYSAPDGFPDGAENIAFVPGTDPNVPITVSSINDQTNSEFYVDNIDNEGIYVNGYTTVLTAYKTGLTVGETYHIRLALGDGSDTALESIVALQAGSFSAYSTTENVGDPGDLDFDGDIDVNDLLELLENQGCQGFDCIGDINGDGIVNVMDILEFLGLF
ncbi:choice-of-anchor L domain-containing protein [Sanyastnella coralliicola]|uniref:choice-of-anchor L domain-containing protein n=1 Tax=Sanyastnella coralliicola TaxID=3069118 RepID=UPI0027B9133A|nr:choice-of-anchor L domain-containing protein [Longitalea sp. SCSIO 12813]